MKEKLFKYFRKFLKVNEYFKKFFGNKTIIKIFLALFLLLSISYAGNRVVLGMLKQNTETYLKENTNLRVNTIKLALDSKLKELYQIHNRTATMFKDVDEKYVQDNVETYKNKLNSIIATLPYVEEIVVFTKDTDLVITSKGTISIDTLFSYELNSTQYTPEFWKNAAYIYNYNKIIPSTDYVKTGIVGQKETKRLMAMILADVLKETGFNIVYFINENKFFDIENISELEPSSSLIILDKERNAVASIGKPYNFTKLYPIVFELEYGKYIKVENDQALFTPLSNNEFSIISIFNEEYINKNPVFVKVSMLINILLIGSLLMIFLLTIFIYRPIRALTMQLGQGGIAFGSDPVLYIKNKITALNQENEKNCLQVNGNEKLMIRDLLSNLILFGQNKSFILSNYTTQIRKPFEQIFEEDQFCLAVIDIITKEELSSTIVQIENEIENYASKEFEKTISANLRWNKFLLIVGCNSKISKENIFAGMKRIQNSLKIYFNHKAEINIYISSFYSDIKRMPDAYQDVKLCGIYKGIRVNDIIIDKDNVEIKKANISDFTGFKDIFIKNFTERELDKCLSMIKIVFDENYNTNASGLKFSIGIMGVSFSLMQAVSFSVCDKNEILGIEQEIIRKLQYFASSKDSNILKNYFIGLTKQIYKKMGVENNKRLNKIYLIQYMNSNYNNDLYLGKVAEVFNTTPKYLSNYFKKEIGTNFLDYLNRIRIEQASELLSTTGMSIAEIGEKVGYNSQRSFVTAFKNKNGVSPNVYRERLKGNLKVNKWK